MTRRFVEAAVLVAALAGIIAISIAQNPQRSVSVYSTYDRGPNGYLALFNVLAREGIAVRRFHGQIALLDPDIHVLVVTDTTPERLGGVAFAEVGKNDARRLRTFARRGRVVVFARSDAPLARALRGFSTRLDPQPYTNAGLDANPSGAARVFELVAGRGAVAFDEHVHGYAADRSFWDALPEPVRIAVWMSVAMLALILFERNVRFAPAIALEPPADRDSSSYIRAMAALLRRGRARRAAIDRFVLEADRLVSRNPGGENTRRALAQLRGIASGTKANDAALLRAAQCYAAIRKERT